MDIKNLTKNKKYMKQSVQSKDNQNIFKGDMDDIVNQLYQQQIKKSNYLNKFQYKVLQAKKQIARVTHLKEISQKGSRQLLAGFNRVKFNNKAIQQSKMPFSIMNTKAKAIFLNDLNFKLERNFLKACEYEDIKRRQFKEEFRMLISKMTPLQKIRTSLYSQFIQLSSESSDYLQYYLDKHCNVQFDSNQENTQKEDLNLQISSKLPKDRKSQGIKGKKVLFCVLKHNFKVLTQNPPQIHNRMMSSLNLNPFCDLVFISWRKFSILRKLIAGEFTRRQGIDFLKNYYFNKGVNNEISIEQFWSVTYGIVRKLSAMLNDKNIGILRQKMNEVGRIMLKSLKSLKKVDLQKIMNEQVQFIWQELVKLIFII